MRASDLPLRLLPALVRQLQPRRRKRRKRAVALLREFQLAVPELRGILLIEHSLEVAVAIDFEVPQSAVVPVRRILPLEAVDDGIEADTFDPTNYDARTLRRVILGSSRHLVM